MRRKILSLVLALCMVLSLMPMTAFAAPGDTFHDVDGHWGQSAIERWSEYGVVNGDGTGGFAPDKQMTRAEFATMLANMLGYKEKAANTFADVNDSDWFADAILKLAAAGVMQGSNGMANPNAPITRQEAAVLMCRAFNIPTTGGNLDFADSADVADWAKGAVAALADRGMMNGVGDNNVAPLADINRASVATLLDNMITEYVTEDKTITGEVSGIVLVAGDATVTVENATLNENLIVAPKADGAEVTLTGTTTASDVVVGATATVKVDSTASAGTVQVAAANSTVEVAGKADAVTVDSAANNTAVNVNEGAAVGDVAVNAPDTTVNVGKDATVSNVAVSGSNANVEVSGKVDNVTVSSGATGTGITANSGATVGKVETSANDVTVSGSGKVENVTANDGTVSVTTPGTSVENKTDSADNVTNNGKPVEPSTGGETPTPPSGSGSGGSNVERADVVSAPLVDQEAEEGQKIPQENLGKVTVTGTKTADKTYSVIVTGRNIMNHTNAQNEKMHWVGFGVPSGEGYTFYDGDTLISTATDRKITVDGKSYNTIYFDDNDQRGTKTIKVKKDNEVVATYNVSFDVQFWKLPDANVAVTDEIPTGHADAGVAENDIRSVTGTAAEITKSGKNYTVKLKGTLNPAKLAEVKYSYFFMTVTNPDANIFNNAMVDNKASAEGGFIADYTSGQACATIVYESNTLKTHTYEFTIKDKAGRAQDSYTVTVDATGASISGMNKVTFMDGSTALSAVVVTNGGTVTKPSDPTKAGYEFGGWYTNADGSGTAWNFTNDAVNVDTILYAKWNPQYNITVTPPTNGTVSTNPATKATAETEITITATPSANFEVDTITVKDANNSAVQVTDNKFTMPASNVTVTVTFKSKAEAATPSVAVLGDIIDAAFTDGKPSEAFQNIQIEEITKPDGKYVDYDHVYKVTGSIDYVTGWTGYSSSEADGYFTAIKFTNIPEGFKFFVGQDPTGVGERDANGANVALTNLATSTEGLKAGTDGTITFTLNNGSGQRALPVKIATATDATNAVNFLFLYGEVVANPAPTPDSGT